MPLCATGLLLDLLEDCPSSSSFQQTSSSGSIDSGPRPRPTGAAPSTNPIVSTEVSSQPTTAHGSEAAKVTMMLLISLMLCTAMAAGSLIILFLYRRARQKRRDLMRLVCLTGLRNGDHSRDPSGRAEPQSANGDAGTMLPASASPTNGLDEQLQALLLQSPVNAAQRAHRNEMIDELIMRQLTDTEREVANAMPPEERARWLVHWRLVLIREVRRQSQQQPWRPYQGVSPRASRAMEREELATSHVALTPADVIPPALSAAVDGYAVLPRTKVTEILQKARLNRCYSSAPLVTVPHRLSPLSVNVISDAMRPSASYISPDHAELEQEGGGDAMARGSKCVHLHCEAMLASKANLEVEHRGEYGAFEHVCSPSNPVTTPDTPCYYFRRVSSQLLYGSGAMYVPSHPKAESPTSASVSTAADPGECNLVDLVFMTSTTHLECIGSASTTPSSGASRTMIMDGDPLCLGSTNESHYQIVPNPLCRAVVHADPGCLSMSASQTFLRSTSTPTAVSHLSSALEPFTPLATSPCLDGVPLQRVVGPVAESFP